MQAIIILENKTYTSWPEMNQNDSGFPVVFNVKRNDNTPFNLDGYELRLKAKKQYQSYECDPGTNQINGLCTINDMTSGVATYYVQTSDLSVYGKFDTELQASSTSAIYTARLGEMQILQDLPN